MIARDLRTVTILNGQSLSSAIKIDGYDLIGLVLPTITSAAISFQGSMDGLNYFNIHDSAAAEISLAASVGDRITFVNSAHLGMYPTFLKVRSGLAGATVAQGADRSIGVILRAIS